MCLQADIVARTEVTSAQLWVLLLGQIVFLVWLLVLKKVQVRQRRHVNVTWPFARKQLLAQLVQACSILLLDTRNVQHGAVWLEITSVMCLFRYGLRIQNDQLKPTSMFRHASDFSLHIRTCSTKLPGLGTKSEACVSIHA